MNAHEFSEEVARAMQSVAKRIDVYVAEQRAKSAERQRQEQQRRTFGGGTLDHHLRCISWR
jgi:DNA topoisomerase VI subunit B